MATLLIGIFEIIFSASFNCTEARSLAEKIICSDSILYEFDDEVAVKYSEAKKVCKNLPAFKQQSEREWRRRERDSKTAEDIFWWYKKREQQLDSIIAVSDPAAWIYNWDPVSITQGINETEIDSSRKLIVASGYRDNGNAHSFFVNTVYIQDKNEANLQIVPFFSDRSESYSLTSLPGADCALSALRIFSNRRGIRAISAVRELGESIESPAQVTLHLFELVDLQREGFQEVGPQLFFEEVGRIELAKPYCDVNDALNFTKH